MHLVHLLKNASGVFGKHVRGCFPVPFDMVSTDAVPTYTELRFVRSQMKTILTATPRPKHSNMSTAVVECRKGHHVLGRGP